MKIYIVVGEHDWYNEIQTENVKAFADEQAAQNFAKELASKYDDTWVESFDLE